MTSRGNSEPTSHELDTPKKTAIIAAVKGYQSSGHYWNKADVAELFDVSIAQVKDTLDRSNDILRIGQRPKTRDNVRKLKDEDLARVEMWLKAFHYEGMSINWASLVARFELKVAPRTLKDRIHQRRKRRETERRARSTAPGHGTGGPKATLFFGAEDRVAVS